jgi:acetyltransferase-like isoleucine patch superfamily enzyme
MYKVGKNSKIIANNIDIDDSVIIGDNVFIECDTVKIGKFSQIGNDVKIICKSFEVGSWLFMWDGVEVGRGGCYGPDSTLKIGDHVGIFENTIINPSDSIEIGDNVGIGAEVMIWTHGAWLDVLDGFPADFGPVKIGKNVWLPARSIVLPNVTINNDVVIGINSIVNRDLPSGCFAAGAPCKVIKKNVYPKKLTASEKENIINKIIRAWYKLHESKGIKDVKTKYENGKINLIQGKNNTIYDIDNRVMKGYTNNITEDLRDFLRRNGIKIYTNRFFSSITPQWVE